MNNAVVDTSSLFRWAKLIRRKNPWVMNIKIHLVMFKEMRSYTVLNRIPQNWYLLVYVNVTLFCQIGLFKCNQVKKRFYWIGVGPNAITGVLPQGKVRRRDRDRHTGRRTQGGDRSWDWRICLQNKKHWGLLATTGS